MRIPDSELAGYNVRLAAAAERQNEYKLNTVSLIAPDSPTEPRYCDALPLAFNDIAEGLPDKRPYAGAAHFNEIENIATAAARSLFGADHANVQPHSVSDANAAAYLATMNPGDHALAMRFDAGGHLTHGMSRNASGIHYNWSFYGLGDDGLINYDEARQLAERYKPKLIVCGASSYPRAIDFEQLADIAHSVGAKLLADVSHPAGIIAADRFPAPFPHCDVVTLTPDKTMLGPHGGIVLCKEELAGKIDAAVHPGIQSSVPLRRIYGLAQCFLDSHKPEFRDYIDRVLANMRAFSNAFESRHAGMMVSGGSDTHLMVVNTLDTVGQTGRDAEALLEAVDILTNRQVIPNDSQKPYVASGLRMGTSWITGRGFNEAEASQIAHAVLDVLENPQDVEVHDATLGAMHALLAARREKDVWATYAK